MKSQVLKIADYRVIFLARLLATMSLQAQAVIVGWHVYELTKSPLALGLIGLTEALPAILCAFLSGHIVDRRKPAAVYRWSVLILSLNAIMLWSTAWPQLQLSEAIQLAMLFTGVFISGVARSFTSPSLFSLLAHIVPKPLQSEASAWNSWVFQIAAVFGPSLGGLLYGALGAPIAFAFPPLMMLLNFLSLQLLSLDAKNMTSPSRREPFFASVKSGIHFVWNQKVLLSAMALDMFSVLFGGAVAVLPMFSDQVLQAGSTGLGLLRAAPSIGSGLVALFLALRPLQVISGRMLMMMVAGFGTSIIAFAFARDFKIALLFLVCSGVFDGVSMVIRSTILQLLTPDHMRGRVSSLSLIFITSSNEIGAFESGLAARALTLIPSLVFGGTMTLVVVAITWWRSPELRDTRIKST